MDLDSQEVTAIYWIKYWSGPIFSTSRVTRFDEIWPLWQRFKNLWQTFEGAFIVWQNYETTLAKRSCFGTNFYCSKWPGIEK